MIFGNSGRVGPLGLCAHTDSGDGHRSHRQCLGRSEDIALVETKAARNHAEDLRGELQAKVRESEDQEGELQEELYQHATRSELAALRDDAAEQLAASAAAFGFLCWELDSERSRAHEQELDAGRAQATLEQQLKGAELNLQEQETACIAAEREQVALHESQIEESQKALEKQQAQLRSECQEAVQAKEQLSLQLRSADEAHASHQKELQATLEAWQERCRSEETELAETRTVCRRKEQSQLEMHAHVVELQEAKGYIEKDLQDTRSAAAELRARMAASRQRFVALSVESCLEAAFCGWRGAVWQLKLGKSSELAEENRRQGEQHKSEWAQACAAAEAFQSQLETLEEARRTDTSEFSVLRAEVARVTSREAAMHEQLSEEVSSLQLSEHAILTELETSREEHEELQRSERSARSELEAVRDQAEQLAASPAACGVPRSELDSESDLQRTKAAREQQPHQSEEQPTADITAQQERVAPHDSQMQEAAAQSAKLELEESWKALEIQQATPAQGQLAHCSQRRELPASLEAWQTRCRSEEGERAETRAACDRTANPILLTSQPRLEAQIAKNFD